MSECLIDSPSPGAIPPEYFSLAAKRTMDRLTRVITKDSLSTPGVQKGKNGWKTNAYHCGQYYAYVHDPSSKHLHIAKEQKGNLQISTSVWC